MFFDPDTGESLSAFTYAELSERGCSLEEAAFMVYGAPFEERDACLVSVDGFRVEFR